MQLVSDMSKQAVIFKTFKETSSFVHQNRSGLELSHCREFFKDLIDTYITVGKLDWKSIEDTDTFVQA